MSALTPTAIKLRSMTTNRVKDANIETAHRSCAPLRLVNERGTSSAGISLQISSPRPAVFFRTTAPKANTKRREQTVQVMFIAFTGTVTKLIRRKTRDTTPNTWTRGFVLGLCTINVVHFDELSWVMCPSESSSRLLVASSEEPDVAFC